MNPKPTTYLPTNKILLRELKTKSCLKKNTPPLLGLLCLASLCAPHLRAHSMSHPAVSNFMTRAAPAAQVAGALAFAAAAGALRAAPLQAASTPWQYMGFCISGKMA